MNILTKEQQARGGRNGKRPKTAATFGKKLFQASLEINDPEEQVKLLKNTTSYRGGVELPTSIHIELYKMNQEANCRMTDLLVLEDDR